MQGSAIIASIYLKKGCEKIKHIIVNDDMNLYERVS